MRQKETEKEQKQKETEEGKTKAKRNMSNYEKNDDDCGNDLSSIFLTAPVDWIDDYTYHVYQRGEDENSKHDITVVEHDELALGMLMPLSLSYDHRIIDGGQGRRFMTRLMENLEEPTLFLA